MIDTVRLEFQHVGLGLARPIEFCVIARLYSQLKDISKTKEAVFYK